MERRGVWLVCVLACFLLRPSATQEPLPAGVLNCCEGDVLFLLDSSGSVSSYEYARIKRFLSELLLPFSLGKEQVRVGLLQVGTRPHLEFGFDIYDNQHDLQHAVRNTKPLRGDTNTGAALAIAKDLLLTPGGAGGARAELPRVLVWLTDGVKPGNVIGSMAELRERGVAVLVVSTGHGNYQVLRQVVTPPVEYHLYFVDIDDMSIITDDLRDAIIEIIRAERLQVQDISTNSAMLQWRPVLSGLRGYYEIRFGLVPTGGRGDGAVSRTDTSPSTSGGHYQRLTRPSNSSTVKLTGLSPDSTYTATLTPQSNEHVLNPLSVTFTTKPEVLSPATVTVSESKMTSVRVSWGPLQPDLVRSYQVEYSVLPRGKLHTIVVGAGQNSTLLQNLQPNTTYLVTVSALHFSGKEKAMSVRACTQEVTPALTDLQLTTVDSDSVQVDWKGSADGLRGFWLTWAGEEDHSGSLPGQRSSLYLPPTSLSTRLTHLPPSTRICVSPIYWTSWGEGLCCTAQFHSTSLAYSYGS
ncbi:von Willebrand factor A domain-containing protein 1 [Lampris incognitus]|uniref:von Willebrand factor A domain-containing protein 1 n=1 Tax=Lampris incognitus TaxID=2546036 RepID=UPI0024B58B96|nr:von Willebrand factor A domain-containing protein 1 [Lampris incognitus]